MDPRVATGGSGVIPDGLELRHLRSFVAVAEELNFGRAAARLFVSVSALSRQIAALERTLGCELLHRSPQRVELTVAGQVLLDRVPAALIAIDEAVTASRSVGGELRARVLRLGEPFEDLTYADVDALRAMAEKHYAGLPLASDVTYEPIVAGGVPAIVTTPVAAADGDPHEAGGVVLLLLHGGTFVTGSAFGFRSMASALAAATDAPVITPDYRLAPEHPFPAAIDDIGSCWAWIRERSDVDVVLVGDCSGAGLALSHLQRLRQQGQPMPAGCVLFTPYVDLSGAALDRLPVEPAQSATRAGASLGMSYYLAGHPTDDPLIDPLHADLSGLPPLLIQAAADHEGFRESRELAQHARAHGVDVRLEVTPVASESFQLYWSFLPEAAHAVRQVAEFTRDVIASARTTDADAPAGGR